MYAFNGHFFKYDREFINTSSSDANNTPSSAKNIIETIVLSSSQ